MSRKNRKKFHHNKHHLKPKSRGGQSLDSNLLDIDIERHNAWHQLWRNLTLEEVISLLIRLKRMKQSHHL